MYKVPKSVQSNAAKALEVRGKKPISERGMTAVGLAMARRLASGEELSFLQVKKISEYFPRHEVDKGGSTWKEQGKGWQAWMGWGGDEGWAWSKGIVDTKSESLVSSYIGPESKGFGLSGPLQEGGCTDQAYAPQAMTGALAESDKLLYRVALGQLSKELEMWQEWPSTTKDALIRKFEGMPLALKQAIEDANKRVMGGAVIAWRYEKDGNFPDDLGGLSLHAHYPIDIYPGAKPHQLQAYRVRPSDVMIHYLTPENPLNRGVWSTEKEIILKKGAKPERLTPLEQSKLEQAYKA